MGSSGAIPNGHTKRALGFTDPRIWIGDVTLSWSSRPERPSDFPLYDRPDLRVCREPRVCSALLLGSGGTKRHSPSLRAIAAGSRRPHARRETASDTRD